MIYLILLLGFVFLIFGAHWLVDGGCALGKRYNIPDLVIGLTIVSIGTSAPELVVSLMASARGATDLTLANVIGSNVFNTLVIIGLSAIVTPIVIARNTLRWELPLSLLASVALLFFARDYIPTGGKPLSLVRLDGIIFLAMFAGFLYYSYHSSKNNQRADTTNIKYHGLGKSLLLVFTGLVFLYAGGRFAVHGAVEVARILGVSEKIIGVTIVAVGTSLPELVTSVIAAIKKNSDIAIGNALGSNIFNIWMVLGLSALITPLPFQSNLILDTYVSIISNIMIIIFVFASVKGKRNIDRWQGLSLVLIYFFYVFYTLMVK